jgi:hypothetical protein
MIVRHVDDLLARTDVTLVPPVLLTSGADDDRRHSASEPFECFPHGLEGAEGNDRDRCCPCVCNWAAQGGVMEARGQDAEQISSRVGRIVHEDVQRLPRQADHVAVMDARTVAERGASARRAISLIISPELTLATVLDRLPRKDSPRIE